MYYTYYNIAKEDFVHITQPYTRVTARVCRPVGDIQPDVDGREAGRCVMEL